MTELAQRHHCQEQVYGDRLGRWNCQKWAVVQRDGKWYCHVHDPEYIAEKGKKQQAKWNEKWLRKEAVHKRERILVSLGFEFDTDLLESHLQAIRQFIQSLEEAK